MSAASTLKSHGPGQSPSAEPVSVCRVLSTAAATASGVCCNFMRFGECLLGQVLRDRV